MRSPDMQVAGALIAIIFVMIIPLPPILLDMLLSLSIMLSFLILLIAVYVREPLDFSTFPSLLLITTLFRLALNVATTRNILLHGASNNVSNVVLAFGKFVVGGNYFVGFVIFTILVIINFIVITKGAGRVAEVGARFTLDAMPGKQMSIDAEMNNGLIDREEAKKRRLKVEQEADFYGSMDGASKFVRGDAIAAIIITLTNIIAGLIIGVLQFGLSFKDAATRFTLLTVGEGLVSQVPALVISTAAGIVVTRAAGSEGLSTQLSNQLFLYPKALFVCAGLLVLMSTIPGLPAIPFLLMSLGIFLLGRQIETASKKKEQAKAKAAADAKTLEKSTDTLESMLHVDTLALEVGVDLIPLVDVHQDGELLERIVSSRKQFAQDLGIIVPQVIVRDNIQLKPGEYRIMLKGNPVGKGSVRPNMLLAMESGEISDPIDGIPGHEPAYGLKATWVKSSLKDEATFRGYIVVNCATVIVTHLNKLLQENAHQLIGRQEVQSLIEGIKEKNPKVVDEVIASDRLELGDVVKICQHLLQEQVSIRDLVTIFETIADYAKATKNPEVHVRHVRKSLGRGIIKKFLSEDDSLIACTLDRQTEDIFTSGLEQRDDGSFTLNIDHQIAQRFLNNLAKVMTNFEEYGSTPILLCGTLVRWEVKKLVNHFIPGIIVVAMDEIPSDIKIKNIGLVSI